MSQPNRRAGTFEQTIDGKKVGPRTSCHPDRLEPQPDLADSFRHFGDLATLGDTALYYLEAGNNPAFDTWGESLWNVWVTLFSGMNNSPNTFLGRAVAVVVIVSGAALAGLFTASIASILIERSLRIRKVANLEMSEHLVLCNWSNHGLDWIREVHSRIVAEKTTYRYHPR